MAWENVSNENSSSNTSSPIGSPATYNQQVAITVAIAVFGIWSTIGNILTILAITTSRYMKTKTNVFILSLAISDLLSGAVASPLWLYRRSWGFNPWEWGQLTCKLYWFMDETTSYCTAMHIASFAIWRYILVRWPHKLGSTKIRTIIIWLSVIWILSIIFGGFVYSTFFASIDKTQDGGIYSQWPMCSINFLDNGLERFRTYYTFSSTVFMLFPMAVLFMMSILITRELYFIKTFKSELRRIKEKKAIGQLAMIAASFMIGYLPMTTYMDWTIRVTKNKALDYWIGVGAYFCLRLSECANPIVYNVSSSKMRGATKEVLVNIWTCCGRRENPSVDKVKISKTTIELEIGNSNLTDKNCKGTTSSSADVK